MEISNTFRDNDYFLLDLKLPKFDRLSRHRQTCLEPPVKSGFVDMLETVFKKDLRSDNPLFTPFATRLNCTKYQKNVRFSTTEIGNGQLPYCRRSYVNTKEGVLHAPSCYNSTQETVDVLGQYAWMNRVFILDCMRAKLVDLCSQNWEIWIWFWRCNCRDVWVISGAFCNLFYCKICKIIMWLFY